MDDPYRLMPRIWADIDYRATMVIDAATLSFLNYAKTDRIQKQNFRMMLNAANITYTVVSAVDVGKWPEIKQEINEAILAAIKQLQWVVFFFLTELPPQVPIVLGTQDAQDGTGQGSHWLIECPVILIAHN